MSSSADFLIEIHTEELPPKTLQKLANAFLNDLQSQFRKAELNFSEIKSFATPRRLAVYAKNLSAKQADTLSERKGPSLEAAFDKEGNPTPACIGFARSCDVSPSQLKKIKTPAGTWVGIQQKIVGKNTKELLPDMVKHAISALPIPKRMRWGNFDTEFIRPVHAVVLLYGKEIIDTTILGCKTGRKTQGHRFLSKGWLSIAKPADYPAILKKGFVMVDFNQRKDKIREEALALLQMHANDFTKKEKNATVAISDNLLDEVTGLVEWPIAFCGKFDKKFLEVPQELLISAMQDHQRYFPVVDNKGKLLPYFIGISNIESKEMSRLIAGNERVLRARLSDAAFFFAVDKKKTLAHRIDLLKQIVFQNKLGTLYDKAERLAKLSEHIVKKMGGNAEQAARAGLLAKTDLTSELVAEFPELQGIAGYYYAKKDGEPDDIAKALNEQYMPRFSGDNLPNTQLGYALALADRLDTLVGVFGINQPPTGEKDPFGLRRAALGILRILIEKQLNLDLQELLQVAFANYSLKLENPDVVRDVLNFILERLKPWYQEQNIAPDVFAAVAALNLTKPYDIHRRIQAVQIFKKMAEAEALSVANKRVSNILTKYNKKISIHDIDEKLFEYDAERVLASKLKEHQDKVASLSQSAQYQEVLAHLAHLRMPVDNFFDHVLVMTEDKARRENRILLLKKLRELFLHVADIALLQ